MMTDLPVGLSVAEVAKRLSVSERHIHRLIRRGQLPSILIGRRRIILASAISAWLDGLYMSEKAAEAA